MAWRCKPSSARIPVSLRNAIKKRGRGLPAHPLGISSRKGIRYMDSSTSTPPRGVTYWPASWQGIGFVILSAGDGTYDAVAQGGFHHDGFPTERSALEA